MKKKILALCLVIALAATAIVGGTLAYFTDTEEADNTFTVGNVDITLTEPAWKNNPKVYPGESLAKDPTVTNSGANPCYVRVKVTGLDCLGNAGLITYTTANKDGKAVTGALGAGWVLGTDGYFYYTSVLAVGASTTALFDHIVIPTGLENLSKETTNSFKVTVTADAIQSDGFADVYAAFAAFDAA